MMKSTLIKDLYGEIDRLKAEVYATREKNGVYIPKDRYYQEENERKAMADQIEQMNMTLESNQKQIEELQDKYEAQVQESSDLRCKLEDTENRLEQTSKSLAKVEDQLKKSQYSVKERDFIISEQRKAENALIHQASVLRSELEKSLKDNSLLFSKIASEDKLSAENRSVVDDFQAYLSRNIKTLCSTVTTSMSEQHGHLEHVEKLCNSLLEINEKLVADMTSKMAASKALYSSHMEAMQNVVHLHKASNNAGLDEVSSSALGNAFAIKQHLETMDEEASSIFSDLQCTLSSQQGELALFAKELREKFHFSMEHAKETSNIINGFLNKLGEQSVKLQSHTTHVHDVQQKNIAEFQKAYEEQAKSESEKLLAGVTSLFSSYFHRQNDLVNVKLNNIKDSIIGNKVLLNEQASSLSTITSDAKRKWEELSTQSENDARDGADFSAAKHCRMEIFLQKCVSSVENASEHFKKTHSSINEMSSEHASAIGLLVRNVSESNEQHDLEIISTRNAAEEDVAKNNENILHHFESVSKCERESLSSILGVVEAQTSTLNKMQDDHSGQTMEIEQQAECTFQQRYMDYEPSGTTPVKCEIDVPSNGAIESLRTMPMDSLLEEFRENHPYEASNTKEIKPSLIPRSPLLQLN